MNPFLTNGQRVRPGGSNAGAPELAPADRTEDPAAGEVTRRHSYRVGQFSVILSIYDLSAAERPGVGGFPGIWVLRNHDMVLG